MKEALIFVCVLLISWCISKMMPDIENERDVRINLISQCAFDLVLSLIVLLRYYSALRPLLSIVLGIVVFGIVNMKNCIQLRKKKDLVY